MKVIGWLSWEDAQSHAESVGGCGGWFARGDRWTDYAAGWGWMDLVYLQAIREAVIAEGIRRGGDWHQEQGGVPLFSDGTVGMFSYRAWGDLLAAIWSTEDDKDYQYMDFYMTWNEE